MTFQIVNFGLISKYSVVTKFIVDVKVLLQLFSSELYTQFTRSQLYLPGIHWPSWQVNWSGLQVRPLEPRVVNRFCFKMLCCRGIRLVIWNVKMMFKGQIVSKCSAKECGTFCYVLIDIIFDHFYLSRKTFIKKSQ